MNKTNVLELAVQQEDRSRSEDDEGTLALRRSLRFSCRDDGWAHPVERRNG